MNEDVSRRAKVLAMILAGGKGERLMPLTEHRSKPAVPFAAKYRLIDFVLSNFLNSGITSMYVLVQYRSQSLIEHLRRAWRIGGQQPDHFVSVVPPQMRAREGWYEGNADAVYQNLNLIRDFEPDLVAVFGADHIYRMDIGQMVDSHLERHADVTVAALPVPLQSASAFGIVDVAPDRNGPNAGRIVAFHEKPKEPESMPGHPDLAYSSMGNYLFSRSVLCDVLEHNADLSSSHDFGRDIIPHLIGRRRVLAYNFADNRIPSLRPYEDVSYWRDVGTLEAYWQAHMDLLGERPVFELQNPAWPIWTDNSVAPPAAFVRARLDDVLAGHGTRIADADVRRSVLGRNVVIEPGAQVEECIILDGAIVGERARLRRVIVDRFNRIPAGSEITAGTAGELRGAHVSPPDLVVLPQGLLGGEEAELALAGHERP